MKRPFQGQRLHRSGPQPSLFGAEAPTMEAVGEFLGLTRDTALYRYFRQLYRHFSPAMAQISRTTFVRQAASAQGVMLGGRNYWSPALGEELRGQGLTLVAPFKSKKKDPWPQRSYQLSRPRYRVETVFSQLVKRFQAKQVWARDIWHLQARLMRKALSHTLAFSLNQDQGNPPLQFDKLLAW